MAVDDGLAGNGGREMGFAATAAALEHEAAALRGELGGEQQGAEFGLDGKVEFLEGVQDQQALPREHDA